MLWEANEGLHAYEAKLQLNKYFEKFAASFKHFRRFWFVSLNKDAQYSLLLSWSLNQNML